MHALASRAPPGGGAPLLLLKRRPRAAAVAPGARRRIAPAASASDGDDNSSPTTPITPTIPPTKTSSGRTVNYTAIAILAAAGCAETSYLAYAKLAGAAVACLASAATTSACTSVLSSPYAVLFGLPLPLFGAAAYGALAVSAASAASSQRQGKPVPSPAARVASAATGAVGTASAYLMWVLHERLNGLPCAWCYASALLSAALATLLVTGAFGGSGGGEEARARRRGNVGSVGAPALAASLLAAVVLLVGADPSVGGVGAAFANGGEAAITSLPYQKPEVATESPPGAVALARALKKAGAEMYGAFWCSHCFDQKEAFGSAAMSEFPYVECYPDGWKRGVDVAPACSAAGVKAFPTWRLPDGSMVEGELSLEQLAQSLPAAEEAGAAKVGA